MSRIAPIVPAPGPHRRAAFAATLAAALLAAGCSGEPKAARVNPSRAHEALHAALDGWKAGRSPEAMKSATPPIVVQDFDWMGGHRLVDYRVEGDGRDDDANLRIPVTLTMRTPQGKEVRRRVGFVVGTDPVLTVFRDFP